MAPGATTPPPDWRDPDDKVEEDTKPTIDAQIKQLDAQTIAAFRIWLYVMLAGFVLFLFFRFLHKNASQK